MCPHVLINLTTVLLFNSQKSANQTYSFLLFAAAVAPLIAFAFPAQDSPSFAVEAVHPPSFAVDSPSFAVDPPSFAVDPFNM